MTWRYSDPRRQSTAYIGQWDEPEPSDQTNLNQRRRCESAFAPYVGFGVLMTSKLGTNVILMRYVATISPMKELKS
jgi:hypothetical protein